MGGVGTSYDKDAQNGMAEFFYGARQPGTDLYVCPRYGTVTEVAASSLVNRTEWYAVIRWRNAEETDFRPWFGLTAKLSWSRGQENLGYRISEETTGPAITNAPVRILDTLDRLVPLKVLSDEDRREIEALRVAADTARRPYFDPERQAADLRWRTIDPDRTARAWREACREAARARSEGARLKHGVVVRFDSPLNFGVLSEHTFTVERPPGSRSVRFIPASSPGALAQIPGWRRLPYTIVTGG